MKLGFCECPTKNSAPVWTGILCQRRVGSGAGNQCATRPCQHGGVCYQKSENGGGGSVGDSGGGGSGGGAGVSGSGGGSVKFECSCRGPWSGPRCERRETKAVQIVEALRGSTLKLNCVTSADPENVLDEQVRWAS